MPKDALKNFHFLFQRYDEMSAMQGWDGICCGSLIDHLDIFWKALNAYCDQSVFSTAGALVVVTV